MKIINKISVLLSAVLFAGLLTSCSEFMLIPISIDYPFEEEKEGKENTNSPSSFTIDINQGLKDVEKIFNGSVKKIVDAGYANLQNDNTEIVYPTFETEDIIDLISGKEVKKSMSYSIALPDGSLKTGGDEITFSICQFQDSFEDESTAGLTMKFKNIDTFCKLEKVEQDSIISECSGNIDKEERNAKCIYLEVVQNNESIVIKMAEHKDLKKYKKYLNKIYSATLSEFKFNIRNPLSNSADPENKAFRFSAELYAQALDPFRKDSSVKCREENGDKLELCEYRGIDNDGNLDDNYFEATDEETGALKYRIGVFESNDDTYSDEQVMDLLYTYDGKDNLQHALKHLDFQLGIKSYFVFYPQAAKPEGKLTAKIKAKLLFNVEPLN
ncbi:hypothetical protein J5690_07965 [bacterium]|nr:hypothetical protein [bacterium]